MTNLPTSKKIAIAAVILAVLGIIIGEILYVSRAVNNKKQKTQEITEPEKPLTEEEKMIEDQKRQNEDFVNSLPPQFKAYDSQSPEALNQPITPEQMNKQAQENEQFLRTLPTAEPQPDQASSAQTPAPKPITQEEINQQMRQNEEFLKSLK